MKIENLIGSKWYATLSPAFKHYKFKEAEKFLSQNKKTIQPPLKDLFRPFVECPYEDLKVVILNDAPFHDERANDGLALSVSDKNVDIPKDAIAFQEGIEVDVKEGFSLHKNYDLKPLANQGVLLLNSALTCSKYTDSVGIERWEDHYHIWEHFIKEILTQICENNSNIVFIFVGVKEFSKFSQPIINSKNYILTCISPSEANHFAQVWNPSHVFKLTNALLKSNKKQQIAW